jgi:hypothetical protein
LRASGFAAAASGAAFEIDSVSQAFQPSGRFCASLEALEVDVELLFAEREDEADLRTDARNARLEGAERRAGPAVARQLLEVVDNQPDVDLVCEKLRGGQVDVPVDTVLIVG